MEGHGGGLDQLTHALLSGDAELLEEQLQAFVSNLLSYHDPGTANPERVYQGVVVGLLAVLEPAYQVRSNRESGQGRPDVMIRPMRPGQPGVVMELKVARPRRKTLAQALSEGLAQLRENDYGAELRAAGASQVHAFAVAFDGKKVRVEAGKKAKKPRSAKKTGASKQG
ncbi:MAG: PD-(D/E)XK nuclease domain-containing protein, partial [Byssovorax sp.]